VSANHRLAVAVLLLLGILAAVLLVAVAGRTCPVETVAQPCPDASRNRALVVALASLSAALVLSPFAFLGEVMARRRIVYRGAWSRAARRGTLTGLVIAAIAGLRLGGVLSVPITIFVIILAGVIEWFFARRDD
jgi:Flp pilus assembly protein CpaB